MNLEINRLLEYTDIGVLYLDSNFVIQHFTKIVTKLTSIRKKHIGKKITDIPEYNDEEFLGSLHKVVTELIHMETEIEYKDGKTWKVRISPFIMEDGRCDGIVISYIDVTQGREAEHQLDIEREKYRTIAELTDCGLWEYNPETKELKQTRKINGRYSDKAMRMPNYREKALEWKLIYEEDIPIFHQYCDSMDNGDDNFEYEIRSIGDNDEYVWMRFQGSAVKDKSGKVLCVVGKTLNIDEEKKDMLSLLEKSELDALTQVYNSGTTKEKIAKCFERSSEEDKHALFIIDIDNFKQANDKWGHLYGDLVLEGFSGQLKKLAAPNDIIGRFGGDEFLVLIKGIKEYKDVIKVAESIHAITRNGFAGLKPENRFSISIGISIYGVDGYNYDELFEKADMALYAAKDSGKNTYLVYNERLISGGTVGETTRKNPTILLRNTGSITSSPFVNKRLVEFTVDVTGSCKEVKDALVNIFSEIGKYYDLGRIFVMDKDANTEECTLTYEWCNEGIASEETLIKELFTNDFFQKEKRMKERGYFQFSDLVKVSENIAKNDVYCTLRSNGIKALICCALYDGVDFIGCIGYQNCTDNYSWKNEEIDTLVSVTKIIEGSILRSRSELQLNKEEFYMQAMLNNQNMINYAIEPDSYKIVYFSEYTKLKCPTVKLGEKCYEAIMGLDSPCETCPIHGFDQKTKRNSVESYDDRLNAWYSTTATSVIEPNGETVYLLCRSDVTNFLERVNAVDTLTGIRSFPKFEAEAMKLLAKGKKKKYAVLCLDINKFKYINDEYGYEQGDEILKIFATLVDSELTPQDLFCRVGADNFIIFTEYRDKEELITKIKNVYITVNSIYRKIYSALNIVIVGGLYLLSPGDKILSVAIDRANLAKKTIKAYHKSNIAIYDMDLHRQTTSEKQIEQQMVGALAKGEFVVYLQPKVELESKMVIGAEALVRWQTPSGAMIPPSDFIPIFEKNGFVSELDFYVMEETFKEIERWNQKGMKPIVVSLNISRIHLSDPKFMDKIDALIREYNVQTNYIEMELTESIVFNDWEQFIIFTNQIRERGFLISIDDFGSGFSSLNLLTRLPIDILKIDKEFFLKNKMLQRNKAIINGIIQLAKGLSLKVISEGVETEEQAVFLQESGCDMAQGFLFYKPLPVDEFVKLISE